MVREILEDLEGEIAGLAVEAQRVADDYWASKTSENARRSKKEKGIMGVRVRYRDGKLAIDWFRNTWRAEKGGAPDSTGKWNTYSIHLKKGKGHKYPERSLLAHAKEWEKEMILESETKFALIRKAYECLSKARQSLVAYEAIGIGKEENLVDEKQWGAA